MNENTLYIHALASCEITGRSFLRHCFEQGHTWKSIFEALRSGNSLGKRQFTKEHIKNLQAWDLEKEYQKLLNTRIQILYGDAIGASLLTSHDPPLWLYTLGDTALLHHKSMSIVGARNSSEYAQRVTRDLVDVLVSSGYTIVSGFATGVDTKAHESALCYDGKTIAVLGYGIIRGFQSLSQKLFEQIAQTQSLIISEYPPAFPGKQYTFPERNRLIASLGESTIIIQASSKSGSLITAKCALEDGKNVYVVPAELYNESFRGSHYLIGQGAIPLTSIQDFAKSFGIEHRDKKPVFRTQNEEKLWRFLAQARTFDDLLSTDIPAKELQSLLLDWQMTGWIQSKGGKFQI